MVSDHEKVAAIRAVTQFSDDYIKAALAGSKAVRTGVGYSDWKKVQIAAQAYELGRKDERDGRNGPEPE
jgi:hypothetical protein